MEPTEEMLQAAMSKAVEVGLFPKVGDTETYLKHWQDMKAVLAAARAVDPEVSEAARLREGFFQKDGE